MDRVGGDAHVEAGRIPHSSQVKERVSKKSRKCSINTRKNRWRTDDTGQTEKPAARKGSHAPCAASPQWAVGRLLALGGASAH